MKIAISQSNYIPWKGYFDLIGLVDVFVIYDDVQYTQGDWRNRNIIKTSNGLRWLTIPINKKGRIKNSIAETKIANKFWIEKHLKSIEHNYKKSRFFDSNFNFVKDLYSGLNSEYLTEINSYLIKNICTKLNIRTKIINSSQFKKEGDRNTRLISICRQMGATSYLTTKKAKSYINEELFLSSGIRVEYISFDEYKAYEQCWGDFEHKVSIIDLFLNCGDNAFKYMQIGYS